MKSFNSASKIVIVSTYPPRQCGIASFASDLLAVLKPELEEETEIVVYALDKKENAHLYTNAVNAVIDTRSLNACIEAAELINYDPAIKLLCFEHEFGLYGGTMGDYLLGLLALIERPFIVRFHTVLPRPDEKRLKLIQAIALLAEKIIVMTHHSARLLREDYQVPIEKIMIIPHGTHLVDTASPDELKQKYNLSHNLVLTTFGLLSPNKGIETGIQAMREIIQHFPNACYLVLGCTHPNLLASEGEAYRESLERLIKETGLTGHVRLINEYLPTAALMEYLVLTDVYLFTSKDPNQTVSGTFLYAMSAACAIISNAFVQADEMLDSETGIIIPSGDAQTLAKEAVCLLQNTDLREKMANNAFLKTRNTIWKTVARKHVRLFSVILKKDISMHHQLPVSVTLKP